MQAIQTKYLPPTNHRGTRYKAIAADGSITVSYDYSLSVIENHQQAAKALADKLGWNVQLECGTLADGSMVHVIVGGVV